MNHTMANTVLMFRNITERSMKLFADIESSHGRDVLALSYNKIGRLVQACTEGSKVTGVIAADLMEASLDAISFALRQDSLKPADVTLNFLDGVGKKAKQEATTGYVVKVIARRAFIQHFELEVLEFVEKGGKSVATSSGAPSPSSALRNPLNESDEECWSDSR